MANQFSEADLCRIKDFKLGTLPQNSGFVRPFRATFTDERNNNPVQRIWDAVDSHVYYSSISTQLYFLFVLFILEFRCDYCLQSFG